MERYRCRQTSTETTRERTLEGWTLTCCAHGTTRFVASGNASSRAYNTGNDYSDSLARHPATWCASCRDLIVVARCDCGKSYTAPEWRLLKLMGLVNDIEMRRCTCSVTLYLTAQQARQKSRPVISARPRPASRGTTRRAPP